MINSNLLDFPNCKVAGVTVLSEDGAVCILNSRLSSERQAEAYRHECGHELRDDFSREEVQAIESAVRNESA